MSGAQTPKMYDEEHERDEERHQEHGFDAHRSAVVLHQTCFIGVRQLAICIGHVPFAGNSCLSGNLLGKEWHGPRNVHPHPHRDIVGGGGDECWSCQARTEGIGRYIDGNLTLDQARPVSCRRHRALRRHMVGDADAVQDDASLHDDQRDDEQHGDEQHRLDGDFARVEPALSRG